MVLVGGHLQGKLSLTGLPWNVPAIPGNCVGGGGGHQPLMAASSQAHQLAMSLTSRSTWFGIQDHVLLSQQ